LLQLSKTNQSFLPFLGAPNPHTFFITPTTPEEVMSVTHHLSLSNTKALSFDYVNMVMLKNAISVLKKSSSLHNQ
jgi:hypothetical protein